MEIREAIDILRSHNKWRRSDEPVAIHSPRVIGLAIDTLCSYVERMEDDGK